MERGALEHDPGDDHAAALAQLAGLTVVLVDLALVPVRLGLSLVGRALRPRA